jgi:hypothetical protein
MQNSGQILIASLLALWIAGLGLSFIVQSQRGYLRWTQRNLARFGRWVWRNTGWRFVAGMVFALLLFL